MRFFLTGVLFLLAQLVYAQEKGMPFSIKSGLSCFYNPAQIDTNKLQVSISVKKSYWTNLNQYSAGVELGNGKRKFKIGLSSENAFGYYYNTALFGYSIKLDSSLNIGMSLGFLTNNLGTKTSFSPKAVLGLEKEWKNGLFTILNIGVEETYQLEKEKQLTPSCKGSIGYRTNLIELSIQAQFNNSWSQSIWLKYNLTTKFHFYTGVYLNPNSYVIGGRLHLKNISIITSFDYHTSLGLNPTIIMDYAH